MTVRPCIHPGCHDTDGNPRLTDQTICDPCRHHYRATLRRLVLDYINIRTTWPTPARRETTRRTRPGTSGHPREWASDTLADIAGTLDGIEDGLRDHLTDTPAGAPRVAAEARIVARAYKYLDRHFEALCGYPGAAASVVEITDLHRRIANQLGQNRLHTRLPTPCPTCLHITLVRTIDRNRTDSISCDNCAREIPEDHYGLYARILLDELIAQADDDTPDQATA